MKSKFQLWIFLGLATASSVGCNWTQLLAFRAQMRAISEYTAWSGADNEVFVFKTPLLTLNDLNGMHIFPELLDPSSAVRRYHRVDAPPGTAVDYEIRLLMDDGKLAGLIFPPPLRDGF